MWRVWYDKERQHGTILLNTKEEAKKCEAKGRVDALLYGYSPDDVSEPEEYDEWQYAPDYLNDLNAAITCVPHMASLGYACVIVGGSMFRVAFIDAATNHEATAEGTKLTEVICEAFLRAKNLWIDSKLPSLL